MSLAVVEPNPHRSVIDASVCICTYNGVGRIRPVLEALAMQTAPRSSWELLIIDNASTDGTGVFANDLIKELLGGKGRVIFENRAGLSFARARAGKEAEGVILCFLDDDNIPTSNYLANAIEAFRKRPAAGVIGGRVRPRWEVAPTPLAEAVAPFALAICDLGDIPKLVAEASGGIVGAGMCVSRKVFAAMFDTRLSPANGIGRKGGHLIGGDDTAISLAARHLGFECWYDPAIEIAHVLPARRTEKEYLLRLFEGIGAGQAALRRFYDWKARTPLAWLIAAKDFSRYLNKTLRSAARRTLNEDFELAGDLNDLELSLIRGRGFQSLKFWT